MREKLPQTIKLSDKEYVLDYERELECSEETINVDIMNHASIFAWYCVLSEMAADNLADKKLDLDVLEANLDSDFRKAAIKAGEKPTEKKIAMLVILDNKYIEALLFKNEAQKNLGILRGIKEAFGHRKDMLWQLASNMRAQSSPDVMLKKREIENKIDG